MIAARMMPMFEEDAKKRQLAGKGDLLDLSPEGQNDMVEKGRACDHAGKLLNVSGKSALRARKVLAEALHPKPAYSDQPGVKVEAAGALQKFGTGARRPSRVAWASRPCRTSRQHESWTRKRRRPTLFQSIKFRHWRDANATNPGSREVRHSAEPGLFKSPHFHSRNADLLK